MGAGEETYEHRIGTARELAITMHPAPGSEEAMVERIVHLGFEVRVVLVLHDGRSIAVRLPAAEYERGQLDKGAIVYVSEDAAKQYENAQDIRNRLSESRKLGRRTRERLAALRNR